MELKRYYIIINNFFRRLSLIRTAYGQVFVTNVRYMLKRYYYRYIIIKCFISSSQCLL